MILLIVDDEFICREGMAEVIARRRPEVKVLTACNGVEAAALLEREPVDGMFLDIRMPGCDGFELMQILKQRGQGDIVTIIVSGMDDFEYARSAIKDNVLDYMLKPVTPAETIEMVDRVHQELVRRRDRSQELATLRDLVARNRNEMLLQLFGDVISGMYDPDELIRRGDLLQVDLRGEEFLCAAVRVLNRSQSDASFEELQMDTLRCRKLLEQFLTDYPGAWLFQTNMDRFAILFTARQKGDIRPGKLINDLEELIQRAGDAHGLRVAAGVAEPCHALEHVAVCYDEAKRTLQYKTLFAGMETGFIHDYRRSGRSYYIADYDQVNVMLHNGELDKLKARMRETLMEAAARKQTGDIDSLALACNEILLTLCKILYEGGADISVYFQPGSLALRLPDNFSRLEDVQSWLDELLETAARQLENQTRQYSSHLVKRILQYVNSHYANPLNNARIADEFGYSPNYIGRIFHDETGTNLNDYIKGVRINRARDLLQHTSMRIVDIARETGFSDAQYFSVVFRQKTGLSPSEFRSQ
ncbi:MAG: helix-turn-helix domain-containing protein [Clostridia bacterium]|nr:helix-turn-helix domain-containing protein [Clostridia bacterium]